jgi:hypothetical protein
MKTQIQKQNSKFNKWKQFKSNHQIFQTCKYKFIITRVCLNEIVPSEIYHEKIVLYISLNGQIPEDIEIFEDWVRE